MIGYRKVEVVGLKDALKDLRKIDPDLRKEFNANVKAITAPETDAAKANYPPVLLSGMARPWSQNGIKKFPYTAAKARSGVKVKIDTRGKAVSTIFIQQNNPAAAIYDMAGKAGGDSVRGQMFIQNLQRKFGSPSRVMWPAYDDHSDPLINNMNALIIEIMNEATRRLK